MESIGCLEPFLPLWEHFWNRISVQLNCTPDLTRGTSSYGDNGSHQGSCTIFMALSKPLWCKKMPHCGRIVGDIMEIRLSATWQGHLALGPKNTTSSLSHSLTPGPATQRLDQGLGMIRVWTFILFKDQVQNKHLLSNLGHRVVRVSVPNFFYTYFVKVSHPFRRIFQWRRSSSEIGAMM